MRVLKLIALSIAIIAALATIIVVLLVPIAEQRGIRTRLDAAGFVDASFSVRRIALGRVELLDVSLERGLGDIAIEASPYQLWRRARADVVVRGARIDLRTPS